MSGAIIAPALPAIEVAFGDATGTANGGATTYDGDAAALELAVKLLLTLPALAIALCAPIAGIVTDKLGRKEALMTGLLIFALGGSTGLYLSTIPLLLVGRFVLGIGVALIMTSATALLADLYSGEEQSRILGIQGSFMAGAGVLFLSLGGALADVSWRMPFAIYLCSLIIAAGAAIKVPRGERGGGLYTESEINRQNESRGHYLLTFIFLYAVALLGMIAFYVTPVQAPFHLNRNLGVSSTMSGLALAGNTLAGAVMGWNFGRANTHLSKMTIFAITFLLMGVGYAGLAYSNSYAVAAISLAITGLGMGWMMPNLNTWLVQASPDHLRGRALGGLTSCMFLGQFFSPIATNPLVASSSLTSMFLVVAGSCVALSVGFIIVDTFLKFK
jgi:MFS family permease